MTEFILADEVSELSYNFEPYAGKGVVPEPSSLQIQTFRQALGEMMRSMPQRPEGWENATPVQAVQVLSEFLGQDMSELNAKILHAVADVCSDRPSYDELSALPYRAQQAFLGWVVGVFLVSEQRTPATRG